MSLNAERYCNKHIGGGKETQSHTSGKKPDVQTYRGGANQVKSRSIHISRDAVYEERTVRAKPPQKKTKALVEDFRGVATPEPPWDLLSAQQKKTEQKKIGNTWQKPWLA